MRRMPSDPLCGSASPRPLDIAVLPETRGLAEAAAAAGLTQTCNDATRRKFTKTLAAQLPSLLSCWREERRSQLIGSLSCMATATRLCSQDPLGLAIAIFKCRECSAGLRWPGVLSHSHAYVDQHTTQGCRRYPGMGNGTIICGLSMSDDVYDSAIREYFGKYPQWSLSCLDYRGEELFRVIAACGSDPASADVDELDRVNARLACSQCSESGQRVLAMNWRSAVRLLFLSVSLY